MNSLRAALGEFVFPLTSLSVMMPLAFFYAMLMIAAQAGVLGIWLAIVILPSMLRFLMVYLEARARGVEPETPGIEHFSWIGNYWSLFPIVPIMLATYVLMSLADNPFAFLLVSILVALLLPAMLIVLAITHSPLESVNPLALVRLLMACGFSYLVAPVSAQLIFLVFDWMGSLPRWAAELVSLYLLFVSFGVFGAVIRPLNIVDDVDIDIDETAGEERRSSNDEAEREKLLTHAYGFASRGNTDGAVKLIAGALLDDRDPLAARDWYFRQMLRWDDTFAALKLAQRLLHDMLAAGEEVAAVKLMLRCRMENETFRPLPEDVPAAIAAAQRCDNPSLAEALRRGN